MATSMLGKKIGPIGYGLLGFAIPRNPPLSQEQTFTAIHTAISIGCNYIDAGEFYGTPDNNSLTLLNAYFNAYPEDADKVVLNVKGATKPDRSPDASYEGVTKSINNCLRLLDGKAKITQFEAARKAWDADYEGETLKAIDDAVKAGKIEGIACSEISAATLRGAAKKYKITAVEIELSLFTRDAIDDGVLAAAAELDIPVLAYSPLGRGFLGGQIKSAADLDMMKKMHPRYQGENLTKNLELVAKVEQLAKKKGCTTGNIAINWVLALSKRPGMPTIIPIPGSTNPDRIRENATIVDLTEEDMKEIDGILEGFVTSGARYPEQHAASWTT